MNLSGAIGVNDRELVAFVGAGGKKTAMHRLAREASKQDHTVGYTTTTHMPPPDGFPLVLAAPDELQAALVGHESPVAFASERVKNPKRVDEKVRGYDPSVIDSIFEPDVRDVVLVKADGARRREFKAPSSTEPVIPDASTVVVVVASVRVVGSPLEAPSVHRPERVSAISDLPINFPLSPEAVGTVLASENGGIKDIPDGATAVLLVNKADSSTLRKTAREIVSVVFERTDRFSRALVSSFETGTLDVVER
jgi:probable selenium-dependent hydroxylase accessory protein YqeC